VYGRSDDETATTQSDFIRLHLVQSMLQSCWRLLSQDHFARNPLGRQYDASGVSVTLMVTMTSAMTLPLLLHDDIVARRVAGTMCRPATCFS